MSILPNILATINLVDLLVFPAFLVWIIRKGVWLYDFQQLHRAFHLVQLCFLGYVFVHSGNVNPILMAIYAATVIQHNFMLHQFLNMKQSNGTAFPYSGPFALRYISMLQANLDVLGWIYHDIKTKGTLIDPEEFDIACMHSGRSWGFVNYLSNYGNRFACDILAFVVILFIF